MLKELTYTAHEPNPTLIFRTPDFEPPAFTLQGAQIMSKFGINVPVGTAATTVQEVDAAAKKLADEKGEVGLHSSYLTRRVAQQGP